MLELIELARREGDIINSPQRQARIRYEANCARYLIAHHDYDQKTQDLNAQLSRGGGLNWLLCQAKRLVHGISPVPNKPQILSEKEHQDLWSAERQGEDLITAIMVNRFSEGWGLLSGYQNPQGKINQLLIGPTAIIALDVIEADGIVHCHNGQWHYDRVDENGQVVEENIAITDADGQPFGHETASSAQQLNAYLNQELPDDTPVQITHWVVLANPKSRLGDLDNPQVEGVLTLSALYEMTPKLAAKHAYPHEASIAQVFGLVQQDHRKHRPNLTQQPA